MSRYLTTRADKHAKRHCPDSILHKGAVTSATQYSALGVDYIVRFRWRL
jgi:hypothetical protein